MKALWCGCVLGLLCIPVCEGMANSATAAQTPASITELRLNSSVKITCSITAEGVLTVGLDRRFDHQNVIFLALENDAIGRKTILKYKQRMEVELDKPSAKTFRVNFTISRLQVDDTDLYFCSWNYYARTLNTITTNGSIIIVNDRLREKPESGCSDGFFINDITLIALSVVSIPFVICFLIFTALVLCKSFQKKFIPRRPANNLPQTRHHHHVCTPPQNHSYYYLSTSVSSGFHQV
ncbi:hypothetical protein NL108_017826 [Boleophthalmus pectinirostris]|uniref:uncharacterized protein LOC110155191 n=1 Tax=Boleophthalmus pectinirostris TaxID=150288 RepID=UPI000A1C2A60|nr:uncharacterized protein LOC110155191 [Boleophthalmus pectinirostris]KAJ0060724.1 hypothetical protein NL108_017826 [Boleophthalmus pectinirostris]